MQGWPAARDSEGVEVTRPASELEIVSRAMSTASARSIASFNSEEGFGSPQMHRRLAKRKGVPDVATEHFEVWLQLIEVENRSLGCRVQA